VCYLAFVDGAVGFGGDDLAWLTWRHSRRNQECRDWHVGAFANVNCGVLLVIVGLLPRWNYGSAWLGW